MSISNQSVDVEEGQGVTQETNVAENKSIENRYIFNLRVIYSIWAVPLARSLRRPYACKRELRGANDHPLRKHVG